MGCLVPIAAVLLLLLMGAPLVLTGITITVGLVVLCVLFGGGSK